MNTWLVIVNILSLAGLILLIIQVIKDRSCLRGYSLPGSIITAASILLFIVGFLSINEPISAILSIPIMMYWTLVAIYLIRLKVK